MPIFKDAGQLGWVGRVYVGGNLPHRGETPLIDSVVAPPPQSVKLAHDHVHVGRVGSLAQLTQIGLKAGVKVVYRPDTPAPSSLSC